MTSQPRFSSPTVPSELAGLADLALDLRWSWSHSADTLWERLDPELWDATHNPWHILQTISRTRLEEITRDAAFMKELDYHVAARQESLNAQSWFERRGGGVGQIAYFSMEFGLSESLPLYSGGLGMLAGDYLKTASDLGVPVAGVGLLWQQGYFRQALNFNGEQIELFPFNDPGQLPLSPLRNADGEWMSIVMHFPRREVRLRAWEVQAGRVRLYLLDANDLMNGPVDRGITSELYGGGPEVRLQQEMVLGIGGWRLLCELGIEPDICHLNEGHAALVVLERARLCMKAKGIGFEQALTATRPGNLFTTHTPVEAGFDRFPPELVAEYLGAYADELGIGLDGLLAFGRPPGTAPGMASREPFNMTYLAIHGSGAVNGVSSLHGEVSRELFEGLFPRWPRAEIPVGHVTNGVHVPSWDSSEADALWTKACGKERWLGDPQNVSEPIRKIGDEELWAFRDASRRKLIAIAREHVTRQGPIAGSLEALGADPTCLCDPGVLTLGFARRFATYKRPNLLLHDPDRLERLLCGPNSKLQLILAGKAHPADTEGKAMIREWTTFIGRCNVRPRIMFLVDYDMDIAQHLVHGVDVWINTPRRPWEACGTSGMKVLVNGGLNLSELDGWWAEAYDPAVGWAIGDRMEHDSDPAWDAAEADRLYALLENEIIPDFYDRDDLGIPRRWTARVRESMAKLVPEFSTNRMMAEYLDRYYLPGTVSYRERTGSSAPEEAGSSRPADVAASIEAWRALLDAHWDEIKVVKVEVSEAQRTDGPVHEFNAELELGQVSPDTVLVEAYADPLPGGTPERHVLMTDLSALKKQGDSPATYPFRGAVPANRPVEDYTLRVVPWHPSARVPLECAHILWDR